MSFRPGALVALPLILLLAVACSATSLDDIEPQSVSDVSVRANFAPRVIEVPAGTEVTWTFEDGSRPHDVKGDGWESEIMSSGVYTRVFDEPGAYDYVCSLHSNMTGRVIVTEGE